MGLCILLRAKKKNVFFDANLTAFPQCKTKKIHDQIKALEKLFKSRPIPFFQLYQFRSSNSSKMPCYEQILQKEQICIGFVIVISDPYSLNLTLRLNELSHRNGIGRRLKLFSRAFITSPIFLLLMIGSLRKACSKKRSFFLL